MLGHDISLNCPVDEETESDCNVIELENKSGAAPLIEDPEMFLNNPE